LDVENTFIELGYDLFKDRETFGAQLVAADLFDPGDADIKGLEGKMDIIYLRLFLQMFDWNTQDTACSRLITLLKPERGVMVIGHQVGRTEPGEVTSGKDGRMIFKHDVESFGRLWREVGETTG